MRLGTAFRRINGQLALLALASALPLVAALAYFVHGAAEDKAREAEQSVTAAAREVAAGVQHFVAQSEAVMDYVAARPLVRAVDASRCDAELAELPRLHPEFLVFVVADRRGRAVCWSLPQREDLTSYADRQWFRDAQRGQFGWGAPLVGRITKRLVVTLTRPLVDGKGELAGVLEGGLDLDDLNALARQPRLPPGSVVSVLDARDVILARTLDGDKWIGRTGRSTLGEIPLEDDVVSRHGLDGVERLYATAHSGAAGWRVSVGIPTRAALADYRRNVRDGAIAVASALALALAFALLIARRIVVPVQALATAARAVAAGDLSVRAGASGPMELEEMIRQFNAMLDTRERTERELRLQTERLQRSNRELDEFVHSVAHDLRTPLRAIDGYAQTVLEDYADKLAPRGADDLRRVRAGAQHMGELIDDILELATLRAVHVSRTSVNLTAIAADIGQELLRDEPQRRVSFSAEPGVRASADARLVRIILEKLLANAWKFSGPREDAVIAFGHTTQDGEAVYFVRDNGVGFDMAYASKLFVPFERLHPREQFAGNGVGLATAARIVQAHGGRIWAQGAVGQGATFFFTLGEGGGDHDRQT